MRVAIEHIQLAVGIEIERRAVAVIGGWEGIRSKIDVGGDVEAIASRGAVAKSPGASALKKEQAIGCAADAGIIDAVAIEIAEVGCDRLDVKFRHRVVAVVAEGVDSAEESLTKMAAAIVESRFEPLVGVIDAYKVRAVLAIGIHDVPRTAIVICPGVKQFGAKGTISVA